MKRAIFATLLALSGWVGAAPSMGPMEWHPVQTNEIARWKAENKAPAGVVVDKAARSVRFLAEAAGLGVDQIVEFMVIGPLSDRAYESFFVTVASPTAIAAAFDQIGLPRGLPADPKQARFWPGGDKVSLQFKPWGKDAETRPAGGLSAFMKDQRADVEGKILETPIAYASGAREKSGEPVASTNEPCAVFALYNHAPSLFQLDAQMDQSGTYGRFVAATARKPGELYEITATWDGRHVVQDVAVTLSATNGAARLAALKEQAKAHEVHVRLAFDDSVTVEQAAAYAQAFALLDGTGLKMNGCAKDQFFFRAFLPDPTWRNRPGRMFQPFEVHVAADGSRTFTFVEEDWSGEGLDPVLKPQTTAFKDWSELPALVAKTGEQGEKISVMFIFAPKTTHVTDLAPIVKAVTPRIGTFYVFGE